MKELIEKRNALLVELEAIKAKRVADKRPAYTQDEFTRMGDLSTEIDNIDATIAIEKKNDEKRAAKLDSIVANNPEESRVEKRDYVSEFRSYVLAPEKGEKFTIPYDVFKRATVTTSTNTHLAYTDSHTPLSIAQPQLALDLAGVKTFYFESGSQDMPSMSSIVGTFGTEDNSVSDQTLTTNKVTLVPTFVNASLEVSKKFIATSKPENVASIISELGFAIQKAVEKRGIDSMNTLTPAVSGGSISFHSGTTIMEGALVGQPTAYIFSEKGIQTAKNKRIDGGSGRLVYDPANNASEAGGINGYPAYRSSLQTLKDAAYLIDASAVVKAFWGAGIEVEVITDATLARKGNVLLIATALADASYIDATKVATAKQVTKWS